jgi:ABC-2 type transport system ATP-binding protein
MQSAISIRDLCKTYKPRKGVEKVALKNISLEIPRGSFFGLLGPNGAGKSTLINILAGLVSKTSGQVSVEGHDLDKDTIKLKKSLGIVPQELILDPFFTVREALEFHAGYYGVPKAQRRTDEIIRALHLVDKSATNSRRLSGGMRRRLLIGKALVHNPPVLILDEPTAGVDIELRQQLWSYVRELNSRGTTIVLTTHYLEEADELCDRIAIINNGEIVAADTKQKLLQHVQNKTVVITLFEVPQQLPMSLMRYNCRLLEGNKIEIKYNPDETGIVRIMEEVKASGLNITDIQTFETKLEDIFLQLTRAA